MKFADTFQESRLLDGGANERDHLAERIAASSSRVEVLNDLPGSIGLVERAPSQLQVAPVPRTDGTSEPRDSHQTSQDERVIGATHLEAQGVVTSGDQNMEARSEEENPYLYIIGVTGYFKRLRELWINKRCRRALLSAGVAMISQQMTGKVYWMSRLEEPTDNIRYQYDCFPRHRSMGTVARFGRRQGSCYHRLGFRCRELHRWPTGKTRNSFNRELS